MLVIISCCHSLFQVVPLVTNHAYTMKWIAAGISAYQFQLTHSKPSYILPLTLADAAESVEINYRPNIQDYVPYSFGEDTMSTLLSFNTPHSLKMLKFDSL